MPGKLAAPEFHEALLDSSIPGNFVAINIAATSCCQIAPTRDAGLNNMLGAVLSTLSKLCIRLTHSWQMPFYKMLNTGMGDILVVQSREPEVLPPMLSCRRMMPTSVSVSVQPIDFATWIRMATYALFVYCTDYRETSADPVCDCRPLKSAHTPYKQHMPAVCLTCEPHGRCASMWSYRACADCIV